MQIILYKQINDLSQKLRELPGDFSPVPIILGAVDVSFESEW